MIARAEAIHPSSEKTSLLDIPVNIGYENTLPRERCPPMGYKLTSEARGESGRCYESWPANGEKR
jgi:hypothetical protein